MTIWSRTQIWPCSKLALGEVDQTRRQGPVPGHCTATRMNGYCVMTWDGNVIWKDFAFSSRQPPFPLFLWRKETWQTSELPLLHNRLTEAWELLLELCPRWRACLGKKKEIRSAAPHRHRFIREEHFVSKYRISYDFVLILFLAAIYLNAQTMFSTETTRPVPCFLNACHTKQD